MTSGQAHTILTEEASDMPVIKNDHVIDGETVTIYIEMGMVR